MRPSVDIVIPVKMPSKHLSVFRKNLSEVPQNFRVNYVLDYYSTTELPLHPLPSKSNERVFVGMFGSPGEARNFALSQCDSQYITFWDVDDMPSLIKFDEFVTGLNYSGADAGVGNWTYSDCPDQLKGSSPRAVSMSPGIWRFVFSRDLISNTRFTSWKWGEDQLFLVSIFEKNPSVYLFSGSVYSYVRHVEGALTTKKENVKDLIKVHEVFSNNLTSIRGNARVCFELMNLKQIYAIFKYGQKRTALKFIFKFLRNLRKRNMSLTQLIYRTWRLNEW